MNKMLIGAAAAAVLAATAGAASADTNITLGRFFGACENAGTNTKTTTGEACIIQSIINAANEQLKGVSIKTLPTDWGNYYDQIKASFASGNAPDIFVMHGSVMPEFASLGALADLGPDLKSVGIDPSDFTESARKAVTYDGKIYGVPMDTHANLWHVNMDIMAKAGLTKDGKPILPHSPEELLAQAKQVKEKTGKNYLAADFSQFPIGVRLVTSLIWQQDSNIFSNGKATIDTPQAKKAVETIVQLFKNGYANPKLNYADSQQSFLDGEVAVLVNGTWVVDFYSAQAKDPKVPLTHYYVADFPTLFKTSATWADNHMWVIPATLKQKHPDRYQAALEMAAFIYHHDLDWARTGHIPASKAVLNSEAFKTLPHRTEYVGTSKIAKDMPKTTHYGAIQDIMNRWLQSIWLTGKPVDQALKNANQEVQDVLDR